MGTLNSDTRSAFVPVRTACKMLKVTKQRIYQLLKEGKINGHQSDGTWLISVVSIQSRLAYLKSQEEY